MSKSVKVRIAVAVNGAGKWYACGWHGAKEVEVRDVVLDGLMPEVKPEHIVWVEADVPLPEARTVKGRVTP